MNVDQLLGNGIAGGLVIIAYIAVSGLIGKKSKNGFSTRNYPCEKHEAQLNALTNGLEQLQQGQIRIENKLDRYIERQIPHKKT